MGANNSTKLSPPCVSDDINAPQQSPFHNISSKKKLTNKERNNINFKSRYYGNRYYDSNEATSMSSNSESDANSGYSFAARNKVRRHKSNIRPPMLLFTNLSKNLNNMQKKVKFQSKKSINSNSDQSQGPLSESARNSLGNTDLEEEIDLILNDSRYGKIPWYHNPSKSSSSETVSIKQVEDDLNSLHEDLYSSKSLPTPSAYLYLSFDYDSKKSKSIEVLDAPSYFFLNFEADRSDSDSENEITKKEDQTIDQNTLQH